ncbi:histidine kinase [Devosia pacifica]|uniref:histidine kinase n=1 Tax=Devosia pacifica TaxID=1335967 RepID=A0A918S422_9HYPH|nr:HAMP domain-containing sensor histidine kinase [Devosia pacifica]GHA23803.1 histidine kinase [Devosia pacifica]
MRASPPQLPSPFRGLSVKLLTALMVVILAVEIAVYLPSLANYRASWLDDRLRVGVVAARVLDAVPDVMALPRELTDRLLRSAGADAIVYRREGQSQLIELADAPTPREAVTADMRMRDPITLIGGALDTLFSGGDRTLRIVGEGELQESLVEVLMPERALYLELVTYSRNILLLSLLIAAITALVLYVFINVLVIQPARRLTENMLAFRQEPENGTLIMVPSSRRDEIGVAQRELAAMETDLYTMLRQRRHLADLGLAVAKIIHDLRNTLTSAQMLSDQVATLDDPKVQRLAPRLVNTLDKAISFAQSVLDYGRESATPPSPSRVALKGLIDDAGFDAGLAGHPDIVFTNEVSADIALNVDAVQMTRVLVNLLKNARQALEQRTLEGREPEIRVNFDQGAEGVVLGIEDNGPGLMPRARDNLFVAFEGSARSGGTGLGLAIARELTEGHGGRLRLADRKTGTRFEIVLPSAVRRDEPNR